MDTYACSQIDELNDRDEHKKKREKSIKLNECFVVDHAKQHHRASLLSSSSHVYLHNKSFFRFKNGAAKLISHIGDILYVQCTHIGLYDIHSDFYQFNLRQFIADRNFICE